MLLISGLDAYGYGDESGTLILIAHTKDAVILSVDSKVTSDYGSVSLSAELEKHPDAGTRIASDAAKNRKLIDVGRFSSCAISGFLGLPFGNLDVATAMRRYAGEHPRVEADEAMNSLLLVAAQVWDTNIVGEGSLPKNRQTNDLITSVWCGTISSGKPTVLHGETYVNANRKAYWRRRDDYSPSGIYLAGELHTDDFIGFLMNPNLKAEDKDPRDLPLIQLYRGVVDDLSSDVGVPGTLAEWKAQALQARPSNMGAPHQNLTKLSRPHLKALFYVLFSSVEKRSEHVGPPYNVRLILPCSRIKTTIDAKQWTSCNRK